MTEQDKNFLERYLESNSLWLKYICNLIAPAYNKDPKDATLADDQPMHIGFRGDDE